MLTKLANIAGCVALMLMMLAQTDSSGGLLVLQYKSLLFVTGGLLIGAVANAVLLVLEHNPDRA